MVLDERIHQRHDPLVGVFDDVMAGVGQPMDLGLRERTR